MSITWSLHITAWITTWIKIIQHSQNIIISNDVSPVLYNPYCHTLTRTPTCVYVLLMRSMRAYNSSNKTHSLLDAPCLPKDTFCPDIGPYAPIWRAITSPSVISIQPSVYFMINVELRMESHEYVWCKQRTKYFIVGGIVLCCTTSLIQPLLHTCHPWPDPCLSVCKHGKHGIINILICESVTVYIVEGDKVFQWTDSRYQTVITYVRRYNIGLNVNWAYVVYAIWTKFLHSRDIRLYYELTQNSTWVNIIYSNHSLIIGTHHMLVCMVITAL